MAKIQLRECILFAEIRKICDYRQTLIRIFLVLVVLSGLLYRILMATSQHFPKPVKIQVPEPSRLIFQPHKQHFRFHRSGNYQMLGILEVHNAC